MMDIFSRMVVGWMVAPKESGSLARQLIATCCQRQRIGPHQLSIHSDRGPAMTSQTVIQLLQALDVHKSSSRPYVSDDNPFIESSFKTLKYRPDFPRRFGCLQDANAHLRTFFDWYNHRHRHSSLAYMTPASVHHGQAAYLRAKRQDVLDQAYAKHPERYVKGAPRAPRLPSAAWINPPSCQPAAAAGIELQAGHGGEKGAPGWSNEGGSYLMEVSQIFLSQGVGSLFSLVRRGKARSSSG